MYEVNFWKRFIHESRAPYSHGLSSENQLPRNIREASLVYEFETLVTNECDEREPVRMDGGWRVFLWMISQTRFLNEWITVDLLAIGSLNVS